MMVEPPCILQASMSWLPRATEFVEEFCRRHDIAPKDRSRLALITEELFTNTVQHGLGVGAKTRVRLALGAEPTQVALVYEDSARSFDPRAHAGQAVADLDAAVAQGRVGGFGLVLVTQMADQVTYARAGKWNRLTVVLSRGH
jgi:anti-sigma regulatory factor (Ser/Thr protein kinase)